jgi:hypothetical protein
MKPRQYLRATAVAGALCGAVTASAGPLGLVSGGAGAIGALGGTLSGTNGNPSMAIGSVLGAGGQFHGAITPPNAVIDTAPLRRADGIANSVRSRAQGRVEGATDAVLQKSTSALGRAEGAASGAANAQASGEAPTSANRTAPSASASAGFDGSAQGQTRFSY